METCAFLVENYFGFIILFGIGVVMVYTIADCVSACTRERL
jgi:putative Mn2+ efflux pump MntP